MTGLSLLVLVDLATLVDSTEVLISLLFLARTLCACQQVFGALKWHYKLVHAAIPHGILEPALKIIGSGQSKAKRLVLLCDTS